METLTDRITRYLLARIRRLAILDLYERASVVGLLEADFIVAGDETTGTVWRVPQQSLRLLDVDPVKARAEIMRRLGKAPYRTTTIDVLIHDLPGEPPHGTVRSAAKGRNDREDRAAGRRSKSGPVAASSASDAPSASSEFLALLREQLAPPSVAHVAVALLVARAVGSSVPDLSALSAVLLTPGAFVLIKAPVGRFERRFGLMLEDGLIIPYWTKLEDVHRSSPLSDGYGDRRRRKTRKTIKTLAGSDVPKAVERSLSRFLVDVLLEQSAPVVLADETKTALPPFVSMTADLVLESGGLDHELMAELLQTCCGIAPKQSLRQMERMALDLEGLSIDALALAVRPGRGLEHILSILEVLGERARSSDKSGDDDDDGRGSGRGSDRSGRPKVKSRFLIKDGDDPPKSVDGIDVVQPEKATEASGKEDGGISVDPVNPEHSQLRQLRVETLSGYDEAQDWALDLKADLQLWRDGGLDWSEMSTKLILSGPPGTGKTTYARALCNSLQVPLLVTSVASWLEPGYLGDVLKRMSKAFEMARENAPVILFIDEIDNIGSRSASRREQHDDYWCSLINRLLELLDGASKTDGVIVVAATNLPEKIDPALLRSGRLEKHVAIPLPDTEALAGILAHHLGDDLAGVLASTPSGSPKTIEATRQRQVFVGHDANVIDQSNRGAPHNV
ncbi:ATP-binding protein [Shinella sp. CPCC 101442]|uniref:AAA family ATPase n=1 Tax=Shinella sp. CPCC 101442 TaxID=2932265 RepID=UPI002152873B|nr:ATP-binding protein [Shinella sp. CPCC 101442]MCR6499094.1 ATP-binding protein [Shinella sp. CPCC 101442]